MSLTVSPISDSPFNRTMLRGHAMRLNHAPNVVHVSQDRTLWHKVWICCGESIPETVRTWDEATA